MCLLGVVVRRYIDFLIYLSLLRSFCSNIPNFCSFFGCFSSSFFYDERYKKDRFYRSLFGNFLHSSDHWKVILDLKSAHPCRYISK